MTDEDQAPSLGRALAREAGVNRYEIAIGHDWSAGEAYWNRTSRFWELVRNAWADIYRQQDAFRIKEDVEGVRLFNVMLEEAERSTQEKFDATVARNKIDAILDAYVIE